jgi:hypothetical protein
MTIVDATFSHHEMRRIADYLEDERYSYRVQEVDIAGGWVLVLAHPEGWWALTRDQVFSLYVGADDGTLGEPVFTARFDYAEPGDLADAVDTMFRARPEDRAGLAALEGPNPGDTPTIVRHLTPGDQVEFATGDDDAMTAGTVVDAYGNGRGGVNLTIRTADGVTHKRCWHRLEEI